MPQDPAAFMSYARFDDEHENRQLSMLRERLSNEVQALTGKPFEIFQDRKSILWGENWQKRVEGALDVVTVLIPIVTPSFFESSACCDEVILFLENERRRGRDDLIMPIYYVDSPLLENSNLRSSSRIAEILHLRNYEDCRKLRGRGMDKFVRTKIMSLATRLRDILQPPSSTGGAPRRQESDQPNAPLVATQAVDATILPFPVTVSGERLEADAASVNPDTHTTQGSWTDLVRELQSVTFDGSSWQNLATSTVPLRRELDQDRPALQASDRWHEDLLQDLDRTLTAVLKPSVTEAQLLRACSHAEDLRRWLVDLLTGLRY